MTRMNFGAASPAGYETLNALDGVCRASLGAEIFELVRVRVSQINGCGYCLVECAENLAELGYDRRKLDAIAAWPQSTMFSDRENTALAFADLLTAGIDEIDDELWLAAAEHFGEQGRANLILAVGATGIWNMVGLSAHLLAHAPEPAGA